MRILLNVARRTLPPSKDVCETCSSPIPIYELPWSVMLSSFAFKSYSTHTHVVTYTALSPNKEHRICRSFSVLKLMLHIIHFPLFGMTQGAGIVCNLVSMLIREDDLWWVLDVEICIDFGCIVFVHHNLLHHSFALSATEASRDLVALLDGLAGFISDFAGHRAFWEVVDERHARAGTGLYSGRAGRRFSMSSWTRPGTLVTTGGTGVERAICLHNSGEWTRRDLVAHV